MTVKELKDYINTLDDNMQVYVWDHYTGYTINADVYSNRCIPVVVTADDGEKMFFILKDKETLDEYSTGKSKFITIQDEEAAGPQFFVMF